MATWNGLTKGLSAKDLRYQVRIEQDNAAQWEKDFDEAVLDALEGVGIQMSEDIASMTPVRTGRLRSSMTYQLDPAKKSVQVGTNVEYGYDVEKRKPFMVPTVNKHKADYKAIVKRALGGGE